MPRRWLLWITTSLTLPVLAGCSGYEAWLRETVEAKPHLAGRHETPHRVAILDSGRDAFLYRIRRIREAERSVDMQTFIFGEGTTTRLVLHELVLAARRGVRVRLLADTMFSGKDTIYAARILLAHPNIELRVYNPSTEALVPGTLPALGVALVEFRRINQRMHNKLMVVDAAVGICGGRNYQDHYFDEDARLNYRDRDVAVTGPVVDDMQASFESYWSHLASIPAERMSDVAEAIDGRPDAERNWPFSREDLGIAELGDRVDQALALRRPRLRWHDVERVSFWADSAGKPAIDDDPESVALRLIGAVGNADREVLIQSPYLVLTDAALTLLEAVRQSGVAIRVQTNSLASTDNWSSYAHAMRQRREMLQDVELEIFEMKPYPEHLADVVPDYAALVRRTREAADEGESEAPARGPMLSLHAKSMVIDDELAVIGSYNLDPRSETLNSELLLAVWDTGFARELGAAIRADAAPGNAWVVAPRERPLVREFVTELFERVNDAVKGTTTLDVWPIEWSSLFDLKMDCEAVSRFDNAFYERYEDVGTFPEVDGDTTKALVRLTRALTGFARPLM